jgi:hypothetical protein
VPSLVLSFTSVLTCRTNAFGFLSHQSNCSLTDALGAVRVGFGVPEVHDSRIATAAVVNFEEVRDGSEVRNPALLAGIDARSGGQLSVRDPAKT